MKNAEKAAGGPEYLPREVRERIGELMADFDFRFNSPEDPYPSKRHPITAFMRQEDWSLYSREMFAR